MKPANLQGMSVEKLVMRFTELCLAQFEAELRSELSKENRLIRQMFAVADELRARAGDQRRALLELYSHPNIQVRLMAAKETLAVAPVAAREMLQAIKDSGQMPQSMDAGMCLWALDEGIHKPT
jgi:hypothetical protein